MPSGSPARSSDAQTETARVTTFLDVLRMLPLQAVVASLWLPLPRDSRCSLQLACRLAQQLLKDSTTSVSLSVPPSADMTAWPASQVTTTTTTSWSLRLAALQSALLTLDYHCTFLRRLPQVSSLQLLAWSSESDLCVGLLRYGAASRNHVRCLTLHSGLQALTEASACAVCLAFPHLRELSLADDEQVDDPTPTHPAPMSLQGPFFSALSSLTALTKLVVHRNCAASPAALLSLGGLSCLQHLVLFLDAEPTDGMRCLTALSRLRYCHVELRDPDAPPPLNLLHVSELLAALTQLTRLQLHDVGHTEDFPALFLDTRLGAALRRLARMSCLRALHLSSCFKVDDLAFGALKQLTLLTELQVGRMELRHPTARNLPALQHLMLYPNIRPSQLLDSLLPLLPLPSLTRFDTSSAQAFQDFMIVLDVSGTDAADGQRQVDALRKAMRHLAHAITSPRHDVWLRCVLYRRQLPLPWLAEALQPLAGRLKRLRVSEYALDSSHWDTLERYLPGLSHLVLYGCELTWDGLARVAVRLPALQHLRLMNCDGLSVGSWVGLATACPRPLQLHVEYLRPGPPDGLVERCVAAQAAAFGRQNMEWVHLG